MKFSSKYLQFIRGVSQNAIGRIGVALTTSAFFMFLLMEIARLTGLITNAYIGLISYLALPILFILGLVLLPIGWKRLQKQSGRPTNELLKETFESSGVKGGFAGSNLFQTITILTLVNVLFMVLASTQTLQFMDEPEFCGTACHTVMNPEWQTYQVSAHANVKCVSCHVGEGAEALLESKLNGLWQMISLSFDLYERPIPTPVHQLRPARETCEKCHWPAKHYGDELIKKVSYTNEEYTQAQYTTLAIKIDADHGSDAVGVHWHIDEGVSVTYDAVDDQRSKIKSIHVDYADGRSQQFKNNRIDADTPVLESREMDCVDCHNRATHVYRQPESIVDELIGNGIIPDDIPYIRREALDALRTKSASKEKGLEQVGRHLLAFYKKHYPDIFYNRSDDLEQVGDILKTRYDTYIHPGMNIGWGAYPSHLGHDNNQGCFRCHNENMVSEDGSKVAYDCTVCHDIFAFESKSTYAFMTPADSTHPEAAMHDYLRSSKF